MPKDIASKWHERQKLVKAVTKRAQDKTKQATARKEQSMAVAAEKHFDELKRAVSTKKVESVY